MLIKSWLFALCLISLVFSSCGNNRPVDRSGPRADSSSTPEVRSSADVVKIQPVTVSITAGGSAQGTVTLAISSGFHVNANPATFPYLIPTEITPGKIDGLKVGKPIYPPCAKKQFKFADEPLAVYEGEAQIRLPVSAEKNISKGTLSLPVDIRVQACDHEQCFPPVQLKTTISIEVK
ncbi:MAG: protein-disulfide reductase DsbD domain-containing protein [Acidobacteriota bacterium]